MKYHKILITAILISGCTSLNDLRNMSSTERTDFVCQRDKQYKNITRTINASADKISEINNAIYQGYRVHKSCQLVAKQVPSGYTSCNTTSYGYGLNTDCYQTTTTKYDNVCHETPVPINFENEQANLNTLKNSISKNSQNRLIIYSTCANKISEMSPEEAYIYYKNQ